MGSGAFIKPRARVAANVATTTELCLVCGGGGAAAAVSCARQAAYNKRKELKIAREGESERASERVTAMATKLASASFRCLVAPNCQQRALLPKKL